MTETVLRIQPNQAQPNSTRPVRQLPKAVVHFAGDSGDGMQTIGDQLTQVCALMGNDVQTFPDFPAEIRAPAGTLHGVSGFQLCFADHPLDTPGDEYDCLVAMNPAALVKHLPKLREQGLLIVDQDKFVAREWAKAHLTESPLTDAVQSKYRLLSLPMTQLTLNAVESLKLNRGPARKCKNMFALGLICQLFERPLAPIHQWLDKRFGQKKPDVAKANQLALAAGFAFANTAECLSEQYQVLPAELPAGTYRHVTGNHALSLAALAVSKRSGRPLLAAGYPITPASDILHQLSQYVAEGVTTFQAEDEMGAAGAALGAAFAGSLAMTMTSGPGMDLKTETLGLAVMAELPMVIVNVQRAGPSTGMPTKVEQADLLQAVWGRHGECPMPVLAPASPADAFQVTVHAFQLARTLMTPVIVLSDAAIANGAEPWQIPDVDSIPVVEGPNQLPEDFLPYRRNDHLGRPWVVPGTAEGMHRIGGLEKAEDTGNISYDPANHAKMVATREQKIHNANQLPLAHDWVGDEAGELLVIAWGSASGAARQAVKQLIAQGHRIALLVVRQLYPIPTIIEEAAQHFDALTTVELNSGQFAKLCRATTSIPVSTITQIEGRPFTVTELVPQLKSALVEVAQ